MSETVETQPVDARSLRAELADLGVTDLPRGVLVYEIAGPIFFAAVENFERALLEMHLLPKTLILRLHRVPFMDITGIQTVEEVMDELRKRGVTVLLCEANERVLVKLRNAGVLPQETGGAHRATLREALQSAGVGQTQGDLVEPARA
jgi:SulP family sulfate permease